MERGLFYVRKGTENKKPPPSAGEGMRWCGRAIFFTFVKVTTHIQRVFCYLANT